jgi:hypothetical protein
MKLTHLASALIAATLIAVPPAVLAQQSGVFKAKPAAKAEKKDAKKDDKKAAAAKKGKDGKKSVFAGKGAEGKK